METGFWVLLIVVVGVGLSVSVGVGLFFIVWKLVLPIYKLSVQKRSLLQTGMPATVTIMELQDTGTHVNRNPLLQLTVNVEVQGRPVYRATVLEIVPRRALGMITSGKKFAARVDQTNPQNVAIDWSGQSAPPRVEWGGVARLLATGIAGQARIVSYELMPMPPFEGDAMMQFSVQVQVPDGRPVYSATIGQRVPPVVMNRLAPGTVVPCKVDPQDPSKLVLDFWGWAGIPAPQAAPALNAPMTPTPFGVTPQGAPAMPVAGTALGGTPGDGWPPR